MKRDDERVVRWRDGEQEGKGEKVQVCILRFIVFCLQLSFCPG